jgi:hypothetical protein
MLSAEAHGLAHHMNRVGAHVATKDGPESHLRQQDREALLNPDDRDVLLTLRKVMHGSGEFSHLNSIQKMKAMAGLGRQQLHEASPKREKVAVKKATEEAEATKKVNAWAANGGGDENSCSESSYDSHDSDDIYLRDSFCTSYCEGNGHSDGDGGGDYGDGGGSGDDNRSDGEDSLDERGKRRAKKRHESSNSLGTPATKSRGKTPLATPAPVRAVGGDSPSLVFLGDKDLAMRTSGLRKY